MGARTGAPARMRRHPDGGVIGIGLDAIVLYNPITEEFIVF